MLALLSGCVGKLATTPNRATTSLSMARTGTSYALPKVQYEVKLTRTLAECPGEFVDDDPTKPTALKFKVSVTATPSYVAGESYNVDYRKLPGWLRTASFEIKLYPNGTLKSMGASAEDRTGEVISGAVKTALSIATVLAAAKYTKVTPPPPVGTDAVLGCTDAALKLVHEADDLDKRLKQSTTDLTALQARAEYFKSAGTARLIDAPGKAQFLVLLNDLITEEQKLNGLKERREKVAGELSVSESFTWSADVTSRPEDGAYPLSASDTEKLATLVQTVNLVRPATLSNTETKRRALLPECYGATPNVAVCIQKQLNLRSGVHLFRGLKPCETSPGQECLITLSDDNQTLVAARDTVADSGIFIRDAMEGQLLFCREISLTAPPALPPVTDGQAGQAQGGNGRTPSGQVQGGSGSTGGTLNGQGGNGTAGGGLNGQGGSGTTGGTLNGQGGTRSQGPAGGTVTTSSAQPVAVAVCDLTHDEAKIASANFPQFGQLRFLPFRVGTFQAREMVLSMTDTGRLDTFSYKSTKAPAESLVSTASDVAAQYATFREARETESRDDLKFARDNELADIQAQIDKLTKEAALKKLQVPDEDPLKPTKDETAAIEAEIALLKAKAERIKAEAALSQGS
ncbi:MAG: hypothetical protein JWL96_3642 [Sphingomonas bacterium]|uniref:hypothetical protein n=1 Tax=Sphingomonas bacterium TaxID=1895847 RepID=UPI00262DD42A|nr:hypothetical protein [Sphingomonas bacterium]MDB5711572.1 hypothetical protein [Sphingomonas bacterium]